MILYTLQYITYTQIHKMTHGDFFLNINNDWIPLRGLYWLCVWFLLFWFEKLKPLCIVYSM